jgi:hypothetical protein
MNKGRTCYVKWDKPKKKITTHWIYSFTIRKYGSHIRSGPALIIAKDPEAAAKFYMTTVRYDWDITPKYWEVIKGHDGPEIKITVKRILTKYSPDHEVTDKREVEEIISVYIDQCELKEGVLRIPNWYWRY